MCWYEELFMNKFFRKTILVFLCVSMFFVFSSCEKKAEEEKVDNETVTEETATDESAGDVVEETKQEDSFKMMDVEGVIYVHRAAVYTETDEGKMKWVAETSLGDVALYLGEKKKAKRTDNQERTFFHIMLNDKEYWIQDYCYEPNTVLGFISADNTILYKSESLTAATDEFIPKYFMVAIYKDSLESSNKKFLKIATYCPELYRSWVVKEKFVKRDFVEMGTNDVEAMVLAEVAMDSKNETIQAELFQNAIDVDSKYSDDIAELQNLAKVKAKEAKFLKTLETEKLSKKFVVLNDVALLSIPNKAEAREKEVVKEGDILQAYKKVTINDDGLDVTWLYVQTKQKKGWIKDTSLEEK